MIRQFSTTAARLKRPFYEIFPQKKAVSKILFDLDARLPYRKLYPVYESIYNDKPEIPKHITPSDLMVMKKVLEKIRSSTKTLNKNLIQLENDLLELAAERGNNDAIAMLAFESITKGEEVEYARGLIKQLLDIQHPLTYKLSGDLCLSTKQFDPAVKHYMKYLEFDERSYTAAQVCMQLGKIYFGKPDLENAILFFEKSTKLAPVGVVSESFFYLGQLHMYEPERARHYLEKAATQGFKESFAVLGFLELNHFNNVIKAKEWFKLGAELYDVQCQVGLLDCYMNLKDYKRARGTLDTIKDESVLERRKDSIARLEEVEASLVTTENRWSL